jgi:hypothetical protein
MTSNKDLHLCEVLVYIAIIALGESNGVAFELIPKLPTIFSKGIDLEGYDRMYQNVDLLRIETSDVGVVCWFIDEDDEAFFLTLHELCTYNPLLYSAIITHVFAMIEYVDC